MALAESADPGFASYEVIVSDAGVEFTMEALLRERFPWARWSPAPRHGPGPNRNAGAKLAHGTWLAFVDDDCVPEPDWLQRLAAKAEAGVDVVEGAIHSPGLPDSPFWTAPENLVGNAGWTANLCVRRETFERLGGFDPDMNEVAEDVEFHLRSQREGCRWVFAADAVVIHPPRHLGWGGLWRETLRMRCWFLLRLKTRCGPDIDAGALSVLRDVVASIVPLYCRMSWHFVRDLARGRSRLWRRDACLRLRDWILLPVLVPYFWRWAMIYRHRLREKRLAAAAVDAACSLRSA